MRKRLLVLLLVLLLPTLAACRSKKPEPSPPPARPSTPPAILSFRASISYDQTPPILPREDRGRFVEASASDRAFLIIINALCAGAFPPFQF